MSLHRFSLANGYFQRPMLSPTISDLHHATIRHRTPLSPSSAPVGQFDPSISDDEFVDIARGCLRALPIIEFDYLRRVGIVFLAKFDLPIGSDFGMACHHVRLVVDKTGQKVVTAFPILPKK